MSAAEAPAARTDNEGGFRAYWALGALIIGLALGAVANGLAEGTRTTVLEVAEFVGTLWLNALKMTVIPLVVALLVVGIAKGREAAMGGRIAGRAVTYEEFRDALNASLEAAGIELEPSALTDGELHGLTKIGGRIGSDEMVRRISSDRFTASAPEGSSVGFGNHKGRKLCRAGMPPSNGVQCSYLGGVSEVATARDCSIAQREAPDAAPGVLTDYEVEFVSNVRSAEATGAADVGRSNARGVVDGASAGARGMVGNAARDRADVGSRLRAGHRHAVSETTRLDPPLIRR